MMKRTIYTATFKVLVLIGSGVIFALTLLVNHVAAASTMNNCGGLNQEAEGGQLSGGMEVGSDGEWEYIYPVAEGQAVYCVSIQEAGVYQIEGIVKAEHGNEDTFFVELNEYRWLWDLSEGAGFKPDWVNDRGNADPVTIDLPAGQHTFKIIYRESNVKLDKFSFVRVGDGQFVDTVEPTEEAGGISMTVTLLPTDIPPTATIEPTQVPAKEPTETPTEIVPTATVESTQAPEATPDYGRDEYEPDSPESPALWTGTVRREFSPVGDVDYVLYFIKPGRTVIRTKDLTGAADTVLEVWSGDEFLATDDDSGEGLSSLIRLDSDSEKQVLIIIRNKAVGFGRGVGYTLEIVPEAEFTPTPTLRPTNTPTPARETATPVIVTATPEPTATSAPVFSGPIPTATPSMEFVLRVDVFIDADRDGELDSGEGIDGIFVEARTLDAKVSFTGYTKNGIAIIEVICPPGSHSAFSQLEVLAPYLQRSKFLDINQNADTLITNFALEAAILPIALP